MSKFSVKFVILLLAIQANAQNICGVQIFGAKDPTEARRRAANSLAEAINSKISSLSKTEEIIDGVESSQKDTTIQRISSELLNAQDAEYTDGKDGNGYSSKACMSASVAAKPYLDSLRYLTDVLKDQARKTTKESCENINDLYHKRIKGRERILERLGQMDKAKQKEYDDLYEKIKKECDEIGKGITIYLDVSGSEYVAEELGAVLQENGCNCSIAENSGAADYTITVKAKLNYCNPPNNFEQVFCFASANVSIRNAITKKDIPVKIPEMNGGWTNGNTERAKRETFKRLTESIASKLVKEIEK